jgi:UDP-2-acetamido-3-amino-2,3-dideoxy-glucuronate N-acetyltransferase
LSIGLIGAGRWGENLIRNFFQLGVLAKVCDRNPQTLAKINHKFPTLKLTDSFFEIIEDSAIQGVIVSTPSMTHHELAKKALLAGKHVLHQWFHFRLWKSHLHQLK